MVSSTHYNPSQLWRAIAISLLLHAVLLMQPGMDSQHQRDATTPTLMAMLRTRIEDAPKTVPVTQPTSPAPLLHKNLPAVNPAAASGPAPSVANAMNLNASTKTPSESPRSPDTVSDGSIRIAEFDEDKKSYLFAIAAEARRVKKYPQRAFAAGWTGTADIQIMVESGGSVLPPALVKSSGYADIDNAALALVAVALKRTAVPPNLRQRSFAMTLPVSFTINDE